jgi:hypothetical protein
MEDISPDLHEGLPEPRLFMGPFAATKKIKLAWQEKSVSSAIVPSR